VRIESHASEQYRTIAASGASQREAETATAQATVTTTSFGFRVGKFGLDYESSSTVLDESLSPESREARKQAQSFQAQAEVTGLRAQVGIQGADFRSQTASASSTVTAATARRIKGALAAYTRTTEDIPSPGTMLASVI
jgi:hypothetical protein